jgi:hypothetical protein
MKRSIASLFLVACTSVEPGASEVADPVEAVVAPHPVATAPPVEAPAPAAAPASTPFHVVGTAVAAPEGESSPLFRLYEAGDALFVTAGPQVMHVGADGSIARDPKWLRGLTTFRGPGMDAMFGTGAWAIIAAGGRWPDAFYITLTHESGFRGEGYPNAVYRRVAEGWVAVATKGKRHHAFPRDLAPWKDGSVLALRGFTPTFEIENRDEDNAATSAEVERAAAAIARQRPMTVLRGAPKAPDLGRRDLAAFDAVDSGEIVAVVEGEAPLAVHFDPASGSARERSLPAAARGLANAEVLLEGSARAWIYGSAGEGMAPYLALFDGETWNDESAPPCAMTIVSYSRTKDGEAWAVCGDPVYGEMLTGDASLWRREDGGTWQAVTLPDDAGPIAVVARGRDDVWVAGRKLLHTRAPKQTVEVPTYTELANEIFELDDPSPPFGCGSGTVLLSGDPAGEHDELRAALSTAFANAEQWTNNDVVGVSLVEVPFRGEPRLALQYVMIDHDAVKRRAKKALGDRILETYCVVREPTRDLDSW